MGIFLFLLNIFFRVIKVVVLNFLQLFDLLKEYGFYDRNTWILLGEKLGEFLKLEDSMLKPKKIRTKLCHLRILT